LQPQPEPKPERTRNIYDEDWRYPDTVSTELSDSDANSEFELNNKIQTFNFKRIYEESEGEDSYTDSVDGDSEYDLKNVISDVDGDNENTITQKEVDWLDEWNKYYI
jgi:hypothetical protein